ncbi:lipoprotein [Celeribacter indicus]|uniref:Lipoprotein n=2 Tax=Celeribacter indicus TaxID=1208324 RepID=A0A0B5E8Y3_9RHOB|nr:lipoprotein [Celeribacter indicus]
MKPLATLGLTLALLSACGTGDRSTLVTVAQTVASGVTAKPRQPTTMADLRRDATPDTIAALGGTVLLVEAPQLGLASGFVPVAQNGDVLTWHTQNGQSAVSLRSGVIVATRGFGYDLVSSSIPTALLNRREATAGTKIMQHLDGENRIVSTTYNCNYTRENSVLHERCHAAEHAFHNTYQIDGSGRIKASRQWVSPQIGYLVMETVT